MGTICNLSNVVIDYVNIYAFIKIKKEETNDMSELVELKHIKTLTDLENSVVKNIKTTLDNIILKIPKTYDYHKSSDEMYEINVESLKDEKKLIYLKNRFKNRDDGNSEIQSCDKFPENIKFMIYEISLKENKKVYFFTKYSFTLIKKAVFGFLNDEFKEFDSKILILDPSPDCVLYEECLYILKETAQSIFNFSEFFKETIKSELSTLVDIFEDENLNENSFCTKKEKFYMSRGIATKGIHIYKNLPIKTKKELLEKFKNGYNQKKQVEVEIPFKNDKIDFKSIQDTDLKIELIKYITNKAAWTSLNNMLTTSVD